MKGTGHVTGIHDSASPAQYGRIQSTLSSATSRDTQQYQGSTSQQVQSSSVLPGHSTWQTPAPQVEQQVQALTWTIQALQEDIQLFKARIHNAEMETAGFRMLLAELHTSLDLQACTALQTVAGLEGTAQKVAATRASLTAGEQASAATTQALEEVQRDMQGLQAEIQSRLDELRTAFKQLLVRPAS